MLKKLRKCFSKNSQTILLISLFTGLLFTLHGLNANFGAFRENLSIGYLDSIRGTLATILLVSTLSAFFPLLRLPIVIIYGLYYITGVSYLLGAQIALVSVGMFISSYGYGKRFFETQLLSLRCLLGASVIIASLNVITLLPINYPFTYLLIVILGVLLIFYPMKKDASRQLMQFPLFVRAISRWEAFLLITLFGILVMIGGHCVVPEDAFDALAYQLVPLTYVKNHHIWDFNFEVNVMAAVPKGINWLFLFGSMLSSEGIARFVNFYVLILFNLFLIEFFWKKIKLTSLITLCIVVSTLPLTFWVTASSLVDLPMMAFVVVTYILIATCESEKDVRNIIWLLLLLPVIKHTGLIYSGVGALALLIRKHQRIFTPQNYKIIFFGILFFIGPSYLWIWRTTGNPVFPFFNGFFESPLFEAARSLTISKYKKPFTWSSLYDLTFHTSIFSESKPGGVGIYNLLFMGTLSWPFFVKIEKSLKILLGLTFASFIIIFKFQAYDRYFYPCLILAIIYSFWILNFQNRTIRLVGYALTILSLTFNILFFDAHTWNQTRDAISQFFSRDFKNVLASKKSNHEVIAEYLNLNYSSSYKIYQLNDSCFAYYWGEVLSDDWYTQTFSTKVTNSKSATEILSLMKSRNVSHVLNYEKYEMQYQLKELINLGYLQPERAFGRHQLYRFVY